MEDSALINDQIEMDRPELAAKKLGGLTLIRRLELTLIEAGPDLTRPRLKASALYRVSDLKSGNFKPWISISSPFDLKRAEKQLYQSLIKPTDGPISRHINRHASLFVTKNILLPLGISPSLMTTFCIVLTLTAACFALYPSYGALVLAGLLFQLASILDGCDGEIARLSFKGSNFGAWYDTLGDNFRYGVFFCSLGLRCQQLNPQAIYPVAIALFTVLLIVFIGSNSKYLLRSKSAGTFLVVSTKVQSRYRTLRIFAPIIKLDVQAFLVMLLCFANQAGAIFWLGLVGISVMTVVSIKTLRALD